MKTENPLSIKTNFRTVISVNILSTLKIIYDAPLARKYYVFKHLQWL